MTTDSDSIRNVSWLDCCPWLLLLRCFRIAVGLQVLLLAAVGAVATTAGWRLADHWCLDENGGAANVTRAATTPADLQVDADALYFGKWPGQRGAPGLPGVCPDLASLERFAAEAPADPVSTIPYRFVAPVRRIFDRNLTWSQFAYYLLGGIWTLAVWSLFGGGITRIAIVQLGRDDRVDLRSALESSRGKFPSFVGSVLVPIWGVLMLAVPMVLLGFIMTYDAGALIGGILWLLVAITSALMAVLLLGLMFGWPIMFATLAAEGSDAFDAISRGYAYSFQRPLRYLFYAVIAGLLGLLGWLLVWGFSEAVVGCGYWGVSWGSGQPRMNEIAEVAMSHGQAEDIDSPAEGDEPMARALSGTARAGAQLVGLWNRVVRTLASAYGYSFFWCAAAAVYLLLRLDIDSTEWDQLHMPEDSNVVYGLPKLNTDKPDAPDVAEEPSAGSGDEGEGTEAPPSE